MPSTTPPFRVSGNDPFLAFLIDSALKQSPWVSVDHNTLHISWQAFFASHGDSNSLKPHQRRLLFEQVTAMGEKFPLSLFYPGCLIAYLDQGTIRRRGLDTKAQRMALPLAVIQWFESYREIAERFLFEWEEALRLETSSSRSQHLQSRIIPHLRKSLRATFSTQSASIERLTYPFELRLRTGSALPSEIEEFTRSAKDKKPSLLPMMKAVANQFHALSQVWRHMTILRGSFLTVHGGAEAPFLSFSHPAFHDLSEQNRAVSSLIYQGSIYARDLGEAPKRADGYAHLDTFHCLLDAHGQCTEDLVFAFPAVADRFFLKMCQALRDFCTYFYSYGTGADAQQRKALDRILHIEKTIPRVKGPSIGEESRYHSENTDVDTLLLGALDDVIETLIDRSPLLLFLAAGVLSTYPVPGQDGCGFALGPSMLATVLADRGLDGRVPLQSIRSQNHEAFL